MSAGPFDLTLTSDTLAGHAAAAIAQPVLSWLLALPTYRRLYDLARARPQDDFERRALDVLDIAPVVPDDDVEQIPADGPLIVAANHPHGALDGLVLASILRRRRTDVRILANHLLARIPEMRDRCFFVDPFEGAAAAARSQAGLRAAHLWLRKGGALLAFPSGEVAHLRSGTDTRADSPWRTTVGRLALTTNAQVVPAFISGTNSRVFYAAGHVHPSLRTALLARELLKKRGQTVAVRFGATMHARDLSQVGGASIATTRIRAAVEQLASSVDRRKTANSAHISSEVAGLPPHSCLVAANGFRVFIAPATQIPQTLQEIGRLREIAFRGVGEGTGRDVDLDRFDTHYLHLFAWDERRRLVVGAYRIGRTDRIVATAGVKGLYTRRLFRYDERLIARLSPALELGRSFVRLEYQKNYNALLLLWKGIGQFVARHPEYRVLFGPVSISSRYSDSTHGLLMSFLEQNHRHRELAALVEAINPHRPCPPGGPAIPRSVEEANRLVTDAEGGSGMPILLRQYLKLNAKLLGFNVDRDFGDALDALMMVDLTEVDASMLKRYLGREEAGRFLARHQCAKQPANAA